MVSHVERQWTVRIKPLYGPAFTWKNMPGENEHEAVEAAFSEHSWPEKWEYAPVSMRSFRITVTEEAEA